MDIEISLEEYRQLLKDSERLQITKEYITRKPLVSKDEIAPILGIEEEVKECEE